jgi:hypothetical protein
LVGLVFFEPVVRFWDAVVPAAATAAEIAFLLRQVPGSGRDRCLLQRSWRRACAYGGLRFNFEEMR